MSKQNPAKLLREKMDALRVLESSMPRVAMNGAIIGRVTHFIFTYTPEARPIAEEEYQLSEAQIQELVSLIYEVLDIADARPVKQKAVLAKTNFARFKDYHDAVEAWHREERCCGKREDGGSCEGDPLVARMLPLCIAQWLYSRPKKGCLK